MVEDLKASYIVNLTFQSLSIPIVGCNILATFMINRHVQIYYGNSILAPSECFKLALKHRTV